MMSAFLLWGPILLVGSAIDAAQAARPVLAWTGLVVIWLSAVAAVALGWRRPPRTVIVIVALGVQLATSAVLCLAHPEWTITVATLGAISLGSALGTRFAIAGTLALAVASVMLVGPTSDSALTAVVTVVLAGLTTTVFRTLVDVVTELQRTRSELALNAVSAERMRISRDLHDVLGHTLSVIVVKAEAIRRLVPVDPEAAARHAGEVEEIGREAMTDIRRAVHGYRSARVLDEIERARIAVDAAGIALDVHGADLLAELPAEQSVVLGWVVREAVTNVVRHSRARHCVIAIARTPDVVLLTVSDDGRRSRRGVRRPGRGTAWLA